VEYEQFADMQVVVDGSVIDLLERALAEDPVGGNAGEPSQVRIQPPSAHKC